MQIFKYIVFCLFFLSCSSHNKCICDVSQDNIINIAESKALNANPSNIRIKLINNYINSVFVISNENSGGTGFLINSNTIITALHVISGSSSNVVYDRFDLIHEIDQIAFDADHDIALIILTESLSKEHFNFIKMDDVDPILGEDVLIIGHPAGEQYTVSFGIVAGTNLKGNDIHRLRLVAPIKEGSSGSPVLNSNGELLGIINAYLDQAPYISFAVRTKYVSDLIKNGRKYSQEEFAEASLK